jgi:hypothetical protein
MSAATMPAGSVSQWNAQAKGCSLVVAASSGGEPWPSGTRAAAARAAWLRTFGLARPLPRSSHGQPIGEVPGLLGTTVWTALKPSAAMPSKIWCWPWRTIVKQPPMDCPRPSVVAPVTGG